MAKRSVQAISPSVLGVSDFGLVILRNRIVTATRLVVNNTQDRSRPFAMPDIERRALCNFEHIVLHLESRGAHCWRDGSGEPCLVLGVERIPLDWDRRNFALARLLNTVAGIGTLTMEARLTIQRLQVWANDRAQSVRFRRFAALLNDRLYVPQSNGRLLVVGRDGLTEAENGTNADRVWVEHPYWTPLDPSDPAAPVDPLPGLGLFEQFLVETQACSRSARWFVAMHEGLLPYVRDALAARFILVHLGPSQSGKTTGAERFLVLHGLGHVKGDYTHAAVGDAGDIGLLVLDNREHADFQRPLVNFLLFGATGGERGRSNPDGIVRTQSSRPVLVMTSIEGVAKQELWNRCVSIPYSRSAGVHLDRERIENEICIQRHTINRALMTVLQHYLSMRGSHPVTVSPIPEFLNHFQALCDLLRAYGVVAHKTDDWAGQIISEWTEMLHARLKRSDNEDPLERHILRIAMENRLAVQPRDLLWDGGPGKLLVTRASNLLVALEELGVRGLPDTAAALARRLSSSLFTEITVLDERRAPEIPELRRKAESRALGIFIPDETLAEMGRSRGHAACDDHVLTPIEGSMLADHEYLDASDECYFLWEYRPGSAAESATQLIRDFKLIPGFKTRHKAAAMHQAAAAFSAVIPEAWRSQAMFVPLPPSKSTSHPQYDGRLLTLLGWVQPGLTNVQEILQARTDSAACQKGISPLERAAGLIVISEGRSPQSETIVLVDDVVTSGAHFKGAVLALRRVYRPRKFVGLFLARTVVNRGTGLITPQR
jgi:hypothetical protein